MKYLEEKDLVELKESLSLEKGSTLPTGTKGLVMIPPTPDGSLVVEFLDSKGDPAEICPVRASQIRLIYKARLKLYL